LRMRAKTQARDPLYAAKTFKKYKDDPKWFCMHATSYDNPNISEEGLARVSGDLTELARRQEIMAEDIEEVPGALWKLSLIDTLRLAQIGKEALPLVRIVVGVDPSGSSTNEAGVVACAKGSDGHGYVLSDKSILASTPRAWAQAAVWLYWEHKADRIVGERNFGGDMVKEVITTVDENVSYRDVTASRGKQVRAEPIFALYEKGIVHHVGVFPEMEEEMISYVPEVSKRSPNRMDALVWALTELFPEGVRLTLAESQVEAHDGRVGQKIIKVVTVPQTERCSACGKPTIVKRGPISHCTSCGAEFDSRATDKDHPPARDRILK
jgi:phage terminase large subunit-like protein